MTLAAPLPFAHLVHADWSTSPKGRWRAAAHRTGSGWLIEAARPVGDLARFADDVLAAAAGRPALLGVDLPIGAPRVWAERAGVAAFLEVLPEFGAGAWRDFYNVSERPEEISLRRPFYPRRNGPKGAVRQQQLADGLGAPAMDWLRRWCDFDARGVRGATPIFWTMGPAQVGKAALVFWREVAAPAVADGRAAIWPFAGGLGALAAPERLAIAETFPREVYGWFGLAMARGARKGLIGDRAADGQRLIAAGRALGAGFAPAAKAQVLAGFPDGGDDAFDAMVGVLGLLAVVQGVRGESAPDCGVVRKVEGWILGRAAGPSPKHWETPP